MIVSESRSAPDAFVSLDVTEERRKSHKVKGLPNREDFCVKCRIR